MPMLQSTSHRSRGVEDTEPCSAKNPLLDSPPLLSLSRISESIDAVHNLC